MAAVIKTVNLTKRYGTLVALSNLNLEINEGDESAIWSSAIKAARFAR